MTKKLITILIVSMLVLTACAKKESATTSTKSGKPLIVIYGDYKCPYCKELDEKVMPKLRKHYIDNHKAEYQFVNLAFLGKDSIVGSRASHAVLMYAPKSFLDFQKQLFAAQQDENKEWLTEAVLDKQIKNLHLDKKTENKIIKDYKSKDSKSWKAAEKDKKIAEDNHIKTTPTAFINGEKVEDPYDYENYEKLLKDKIK
ncbi:protein-disulfide isomerase [Staphylococcus schweitzeri]|uniref:DsbA family protein n=1 Tax=Staphylococcus schweitzeri TaxID=1654388 RepID=A0A2K4AFQ0_9STAP|nr:DsbA family protein [Staphylococcus schweitzeri]MBE2129008.1 DsbA family protein [Staphylococcus schweitzeri]PNZ48921.1 protein-disulfide isomerase [Staphylococcus schweitzeri]CDR53911.1 Protein-disulfide isomerase%2C DsbA-like protein [Staphylococcus schweitzeri]VEE66860.1 Thiol-disulfide oxidoreductase D [Staphylococcus schweitzeri]